MILETLKTIELLLAYTLGFELAYATLHFIKFLYFRRQDRKYSVYKYHIKREHYLNAAFVNACMALVIAIILLSTQLG